MSSAELMNNEELCALAKSGDSNAQDALVENNLGFIRRTASFMISGSCALSAESKLMTLCKRAVSVY